MTTNNSPAIQRYIAGLKRIETVGKASLTTVLALVIAFVGYAILSHSGRVFNFETDWSTSLINLFVMAVFFCFLLLTGLYLFIWKPSQQAFLLMEAELQITKIGNSYYTDASQLYIPSPWIGLLPTQKTVKCLLGQWSRFSLTHNGYYLIGIGSEGFDMDKQQGSGFFKYNNPIFLIVGTLLAVIPVFITLGFYAPLQGTKHELAVLMALVASGLLFVGLLLYLVFSLFRNYRIKQRIKADLPR